MRASRVCPVPGCPTLTPGGRCKAHARPNATARGYGTDHRKLREKWRPIVESGGVMCGRCKGHIVPGTPWDLGHVDGDPSRYNGPEHANECNRSAAGRAAHGLEPISRAG
jgi:hypothetical protein